MRSIPWHIAIALVMTFAAQNAMARTWTDRTGRQVDAELVRLIEGKVEIKRTSDGKMFQVPLERFSDEDQAFVVAPFLPEKISVEEAEELLKDARIKGQGCGGTKWSGEHWSYYQSMYEQVTVPWLKAPMTVFAGFVFGGQPTEHHLIELSGPGFRFRRDDKSEHLHRVDAPQSGP